MIKFKLTKEEQAVMDAWSSNYRVTPPQKGRPSRYAFDPDQPRDEGGRWTDTGGESGSRSAPAGRSERKGAGGKLISAIQAAGGFTVQPITKEAPKPGDKAYAISPYKDRERVLSAAALKPHDLAQYVSDNRDLLIKPDHFFGGWRDDGNVFLDVSVVVREREAAERLATSAEQLAYFDFETMNAVPTDKAKPHASRAKPRLGLMRVDSGDTVEALASMYELLVGRAPTEAEMGEMRKVVQRTGGNRK